MAETKDIPCELSACFNEPEMRRQLVEQYGDHDTLYSGTNNSGETVQLSFDKERGIIQHTFQNNGWLRVNYYDKDGRAAGETYDGKWK